MHVNERSLQYLDMSDSDGWAMDAVDQEDARGHELTRRERGRVFQNKNGPSLQGLVTARQGYEKLLE